MYLRYGNYQHPIAEAGITIVRTTLRNAGDEAYGYQEDRHIQGLLQASDQASLTTAIQGMQAGYSIQGQAIGLFLDNGAQSAHGVNVAQTIGNAGVRVVRGPSFHDGPAEYSTFRTYSIDISFQVPYVADCWLSFSETLSLNGGGSRWAYLNTLTGLPQAQLLNAVTPQKIVQEGSAVGFRSYPQPMAPLLAQFEHTDQRRIRRKSPRRYGPIGRPSYQEFEVTWSYTFEIVVPLTQAIPNYWFN